ncbi:hypothetical protein NKG05_20525 [Oerskovia sp. M15]
MTGLPRTCARRRSHEGQALAPLVVAGMTSLSTVDWPGRIVATVFLQGCPWRCTFCHNRT